MDIGTLVLWGGFLSGLAGVLCFDLFVVHRKTHPVGVREALLWSAIWIGLAMLFAGGVFVLGGSGKGTEFLTGYVIEKSLSVDNVFIFLVIFQYFAVPPSLQPKVLHWGILGALTMRLTFILAGAALLHAFDWMIFIFGGVLLVTAARLAFQGDHEIHPDKNPVLRVLRRFLPISDNFDNGWFFGRQGVVLAATPLLAVLVIIETTDLVFAMDSIPAIFAVTRDPFIVFTSNAFAILGLRALYFALAGVMGYFTYLRQGLVVILGFVGTKMIVSEWYTLPTAVSLGVVAGILLAAAMASLLFGRRAEQSVPAVGRTLAVEPVLVERD